MKYLFRDPQGVYHFRRAVPTKLRAVFKKNLTKRTLQTVDYQVALSACCRLYYPDKYVY